jgi:hypothetical protein
MNSYYSNPENVSICCNSSWSRVLLQKPIGAQLINKLLVFCWTRKFNTVFTRARNWTLWIQSTYSHPISLISVLIVHSHLCPRSFELFLSFRISQYHFLYLSFATCVLFHLIFLDFIILLLFGAEQEWAPHYAVFSILLSLHLSWVQIFSQHSVD